MRILYHHRTQAEDGQAVHIRALQRALTEQGHRLREVALVSRAEGQAPRPARRFSPWGLIARAPRAVRAII